MIASPAATRTRAIGRLHAWRVRWFGERDAVDAQLADMARQGAGMARIAHLCAAVLLVLFSAASFVALGGDTLTEILAGWRHGQVDIPAAISLSVITLMVLAFDVGMLYAASMLRLLATRRAGIGERWVHVLVMVSVAAIEASTYVYMAYRYERPLTWLAWALIVVRAAAAPLLAVYLSMARPLPVTARDILAQTELASGAGVLRDVVSIANDASAPLADKVSIYGASAVMAPAERSRLDTLLAVVQQRQQHGGMEEKAAPLAAATPREFGTAQTLSLAAPDPQDARSGRADSPDPTDPTPPTDPNPDAPDPPPNDGPNGHYRDKHAGALAAMPPIRLVAPPEWRRAASNGHGGRDMQRETLLRTQAFALLDQDPHMSRNALRAALKVRRETAARLYAQWQHEQSRPQPQAQAAAAR
jgi:hypothetical protein